MSRRAAPLVFLLVVISWVASASAGGIVNGEFTDEGTPPNPFEGWTTFGSYDPPTNGGGFARFVETGWGPQLEQEFELPAFASTLSFEFWFETIVRCSNGNLLSDSFQVTLWDSAGDPLLSRDPFFPGFYSIDTNPVSEFYDPLLVSVDEAGGRRLVTLDVSSLSPQTVILDFTLNSGINKIKTIVNLDNVKLTTNAPPEVVPEPCSLAIWGLMAGVLVGTGGVRRNRRQKRCA